MKSKGSRKIKFVIQQLLRVASATVFILGCKSKVDVDVKKGPPLEVTEEAKAGNVTNSILPQNTTVALPVPELLGIDRLVAKAGDVVKVSGKNLTLDPPVYALLQDKKVSLSKNPQGEFEFKMIGGLTPGTSELTLSSSEGPGKGKLALIAEGDDLPIITAAQDKICSDVSYRTASGELKTGSRDCSMRPTCGSGTQSNCLLPESHVAVLKTELVASAIKSGTTIGGVRGTYFETTYSNCSGNSQVGCVTTSTYKSADLSNLAAANIRSGVSIAGVLGQYPSVSNPLAGADTTADLDSATFDAKLKSATDFEWFDSTGARHIKSGDPDIDASNIKNGVTIFGTLGTAPMLNQCNSSVQATCESDVACRWQSGACEINPWHIRTGITIGAKQGSLKTNCRNTVRTASYNWDGTITVLPNTSETGGTNNDFWDTLDDGLGFSTSKVTAWSDATVCGSSNWTDVTTINGGTSLTTCGTSNTCIFRDELSGLRVTGIMATGAVATDTASPGTFQWNAAVQACEQSTYGGYTQGTWRLPTQKELFTLYQNGIISLAQSDFHTLTNYQNQYWSATGSSTNGAMASQTILATGESSFDSRGNSRRIFCVH